MKKVLKKQRGNKKGFTLVEMIVVIAIIGVLAAMMVPSLLGYIDKANTSNNRAAATNIGRAAQAVLAELNDSTISGTYTAKEASELGIDQIDADDGISEGFQKGIEEMFANDKFKGYFCIKITNGSQVEVNYSKAEELEEISTDVTVSNKDLGVYPE